MDKISNTNRFLLNLCLNDEVLGKMVTKIFILKKSINKLKKNELTSIFNRYLLA